jgi:hypothetical protein
MDTALDRLLAEFPELRSWPREDLLDMLGSVSPRMTHRNGQIQQRYHALRKAA